ncbi:MAG: hypothetical protein GVY29_08350, partial [Spirochaetes bacterium]|nr:hypothetical protein [Spirochaetota bacterium]
MMRRSAIRLLVLAGLLLLFAVSCYWTPQDEENVEGSLSLDMSGISTQADVTGNTARVYLLAEKGKSQGLYPLGDGEDYVDVDVDDTLTIDGIAPGYSYRVLISFGTDRGSWFEVSEYAESDSVEVESGSQAEVEVSVVDATQFLTYPSSGASGLNGKELNGVVHSGSNVFVTDSTNVYGANAALTADVAAADPAAGTINSISRGDGSSPLLVNTSNGIYHGTSSSLNQSSYTGSVTLSAYFDNGGENKGVVFQGPGVFGASDGLESPIDDWVIVDVGDVIAGDAVRDYSVNSGTGIAVVSAFGSFVADTIDFTTLETGSDTEWDTIANEVSFLEEFVPARILSVGYGGSTLYVGTDDGVYESDGTRPPFDSANTIISEIASDGTDVAFLGPYYLFIYDDS